MSANDAGFKTIRDSYRFFLNTNFTHYYTDTAWTATGVAEGPKSPTIDEFFQVLPFEEYDRDFLDAAMPSQPLRVAPSASYDPAFLPGRPATGSTNLQSGATWLTDDLSAQPLDFISIDGGPLNALEQFSLKRLAVPIEFEKLQSSVNRLKAGATTGPDAREELIRAGRAMLLRELSRMAINGDGNNNTVNGLHRLYDGTFGVTSGSTDRQVVRSAAASWPPTTASAANTVLVEVQDLVRLVSPSEGSFGMGPNALLTSWKARDLLIRCERLMGVTPQFLPDARTGSLRYHFDGVPVYVGPVRDDEEAYADPGQLTPAFGGTEGAYTSIYAARLGGETGVRMLHYGGSTADKGVQVEPLAEQSGNITRGSRLTGYYTLFVPERQAVARLWNFLTGPTGT